MARLPGLGQVRELLKQAGRILRADGERTRTQRDAATAFLVRTASAAIVYLSQVVLARWMGGHEYGIYVFVWTWVLVLGGLSTLGMPVAMMRLLPQYVVKGEFALVRGLVRSARLVALGTGTAVALIGLAVLWLLGDRIASPYVLPVYLALACLPLCALSDLQDGIARGRGWIAVGLLPPYVLRPLMLIACMTLAHQFGLPMDARTGAASAVVAAWVSGLVQTVLLNFRLRGEIPAGPRRYDFKTWRATTLPLLVLGTCELALQSTDVLVVSAYLTPNEVGMYFAAAKTMSLVLFVHYAVGSAVGNRFSALSARGDQAGLQAFVRDAVRWTFWPSLVAAGAILALGKPLLWLFNPQFTEAYPVMFILAVGYLVRASMGPADYVLNMLGERWLCAAVLAVSAILNIALAFALVPVFGMKGAAAATSMALMTAAILNYVVARRRLELEISVWTLRKR